MAAERPGIKTLLDRLKNDGHELVLWTNSTGDRAKVILREHAFTKYFSEYIFREDYDPENRDLPKDIRKIKGDIFIDDDRKEIDFTNKNKKRGILISPYRKGTPSSEEECEKIYRQISEKCGGIFSVLFRS